MMHIVVCVKAVPGSTEVRMDPVTHTIIRDGGAAVVNPFDATALEVALRIKDARANMGGPTRVSALSMGIPATESLLRDCIARAQTTPCCSLIVPSLERIRSPRVMRSRAGCTRFARGPRLTSCSAARWRLTVTLPR